MKKIKFTIDIILLMLIYTCALPLAFLISIWNMADEMSDGLSDWLKKDKFK